MLLTELLSRKSLVLSAKNLSLSPFWLETAKPGLGCHITRNIFSEVGYRYLYDDFRDTNFLYQLSLHGAQVTVGINF